MPEQSGSKDPAEAAQTATRRVTIGGKSDIASLAPPEDVERLYSILIKEGTFAFEDEFKKVCPGVEVCWAPANVDGNHFVYRWRMERASYLRADAERREEARRPPEGK